MLKYEIHKIQVRAVLVLQNIGDSRAIPALKNLLASTSDEFLIGFLEEAIETIQQKNKR